ncbi:MAG: isocitrate/isopropylmalate dehydrogenase family protein [Methanomassiliicoccales archaeon]
MSTRAVVVDGDGVGPEVISATLTVLEEVDAPLELVRGEMGLECHRRTGEYLPRETLDLLDDADACLFGAVTSPAEEPQYRSPVLTIRRRMGLFVNLRPVKRLAPDLGLVDLDLIIFRENTEGMYTGVETFDRDSVILERRVSEPVCRRLVRFANDLSVKEGRRRLTCVHKANVMRKSDGLFREVFYRELEGSPLVLDDMLVDAMAAALVTNGTELDSLVTLNLYGDILSDEAAALVGGMGFAPSANLGEAFGLFEPVHGSAPDIAGQGRANPVATMLSAAMMLRYLDMVDLGNLVERAVTATLNDGVRTVDAGGEHRTDEFAHQVVRRLDQVE